MRGLIAILIIAVVVAELANAAPAESETESSDCNGMCTYEFMPTCGYDGSCYQKFPNPCTFDFAKCSRKSSLEKVDMSLCDQAVKDNHPQYKICPNE